MSIILLLVLLVISLFYNSYDESEYVCDYTGSFKKEISIFYLFSIQQAYDKSCLEKLANSYDIVIDEHKWTKTSGKKLRFFGKQMSNSHAKAPESFHLISINDQNLKPFFSRDEVVNILDTIGRVTETRPERELVWARG